MRSDPLPAWTSLAAILGASVLATIAPFINYEWTGPPDSGILAWPAVVLHLLQQAAVAGLALVPVILSWRSRITRPWAIVCALAAALPVVIGSLGVSMGPGYYLHFQSAAVGVLLASVLGTLLGAFLLAPIDSAHVSAVGAEPARAGGSPTPPPG